MRAIAAAVLLGCASAAQAQLLTAEYVEANAGALWAAFKRDHNKEYGANEAERFAIFKTNMLKAAALQKAEPLARYGATPFADLTQREFAVYHNAGPFFAAANRSELPFDRTVYDTPLANASIDWRDHGAVTHIKNQGECGSCWSFSTTGNIEGQYFLAKKGPLTPFSEQQLVACDRDFGDMGCQGGLPTQAYKYIQNTGGLEAEADYPYTSGLGIRGECKFDASKVKAKLTGGMQLESSEKTMLSWMSRNGPLSVGVNAAGLGWQFYLGGIMKHCPQGNNDHAVLIVGYGTDGNEPYWLVKNSWGTIWGEHGYVKIAYGSNQCSIDYMPSSAKL